MVTAYQLQTAVTDENVAQIEPEVKALLTQLVSQAQSNWDRTLSSASVGGHPAFVADNVGSVAQATGQLVESRVAFVFAGTTQYLINCQYEADSKSRVLGACDQVTSTFQVTG